MSSFIALQKQQPTTPEKLLINGERGAKLWWHTSSSMNYPYACEIEISFPTALHARQTMQVMQVDAELGDNVHKKFELIVKNQADVAANADHLESDRTILKVRFEATQCKLLRVAVSSFYDYLVVALKCYQEFDSSLR